MQQLHATSLCSQQAAWLLRNSVGSCALTCSVSMGQLYKPEQDKKHIALVLLLTLPNIDALPLLKPLSS